MHVKDRKMLKVPSRENTVYINSNHISRGVFVCQELNV